METSSAIYHHEMDSEVGRFRVNRLYLPHAMSRAHWHDVLELDFVHRGHGTLVIDGQTRPIASGMVLVIPPGITHRTTPAADQPHWNYRLYFRPETLGPLGSRAVEFARDISNQVHCIPAERFGDLWENLFSGLSQEYRRSDQGWSLSAYAKLLDACLLVARCSDAGQRRTAMTPSPPAQYVCAIMDYVNGHLDEALSLGAIAAMVGLHPNYVSALFRQQTGSPLFAYIAAQRARRGHFLLASTSLTVAEVAQRCGYQSVSSFHRLMRDAYGQSPARLRPTPDAEALS